MEDIQDVKHLNKLTKTQLLEQCKNIGLIKYKSKNKRELINLISQNKKYVILENKDENKDEKDRDIIIINNDCMLELQNLEDNSIDCVITDPPYFIDKLDNEWSSTKVNGDIKNSHIKHLPKELVFL